MVQNPSEHPLPGSGCVPAAEHPNRKAARNWHPNLPPPDLNHEAKKSTKNKSHQPSPPQR